MYYNAVAEVFEVRWTEWNNFLPTIQGGRIAKSRMTFYGSALPCSVYSSLIVPIKTWRLPLMTFLRSPHSWMSRAIFMRAVG